MKFAQLKVGDELFCLTDEDKYFVSEINGENVTFFDETEVMIGEYHEDMYAIYHNDFWYYLSKEAQQAVKGILEYTGESLYIDTSSEDDEDDVVGGSSDNNLEIPVEFDDPDDLVDDLSEEPEEFDGNGTPITNEIPEEQIQEGPQGHSPVGTDCETCGTKFACGIYTREMKKADAIYPSAIPDVILPGPVPSNDDSPF
jgi:hypothetical protein